MAKNSNKSRHKTMLTFVLGVFLCTSIVAYFVIRDTVRETIENQAVAFAEIATVQATTARSVYAKEVAEKLRQDGFGPSVDYAHMKGYVPIPAQFLKMLGQASNTNTSHLFQYKPVSKWNLDAGQGLGDDFLRWAWPQIEQQDKANPDGPIAWKPIWRFEQQQGQRVLRYLSADAATQPSCIACHNAYESKPEIVERRKSQHIQAGKQWHQYQLLGAISITIPLSKVETLAVARVQRTSILIFGILFASLILAIWFSRRLVKQEVSLQEVERELLRSEKEMQDAKELLLAKQDVERAFSELSAYLQAIDQHAIVSVATPDGRIIQVNQKFCEVSGYSEQELIGQDHNIVNSGTHPSSFFSEMWQTIARGDIWSGEICNRTKSGALYWVDSSIVPLKDQDGKIVRYISIRLDITGRKKTELHMAHLANHDALTGLPNRYLLQDRFKAILARCRRSNMQTAVIFVDLDKFKPINDTLGHKVGDLLLIEVSQRLRSGIREVDTVSRHGGDEFIILLADIANIEDAAMLAQKLLHSLIEPYQIMGHELSISASMGISIFPQDGDDMEGLLKHSDLAMYYAKRNGGNNCQFYTPDMHK
ncbi:diguanylate cyclase domain-containing protein [Ferriphaselus amnicola]|nr:diguanylate cyclase [Ferriphaselus amnicola]